MKKKLTSLALAGALTMASIGVASAAINCNITNGNGSGSTNTCTISENFTVSVTCSNGINASFNNSQAATSGSASANGNTIVGNVSSGNAENAANFANELAAFCVAATTDPEPEPEPQPQPETPQVQGESTTVAVLPATGSSSPIQTATIVAALAGAATILAKIGALAYCRIRK